MIAAATDILAKYLTDPLPLYSVLLTSIEYGKNTQTAMASDISTPVKQKSSENNPPNTSAPDMSESETVRYAFLNITFHLP